MASKVDRWRAIRAIPETKPGWRPSQFRYDHGSRADRRNGFFGRAATGNSTLGKRAALARGEPAPERRDG